MFKHGKGGKVFSKYMDKTLACFHVCGKLMVAYQNLTPSLHFLSLFNYNQLLFATFFLIHKKFVDTLNIFSIESCCACLNIARMRFFFQNTWTRSYHVSIYSYNKIITNVSKILRKSSWSSHGAPCSMISPWKSFY
jgi:hypothetical protein